MIEYQIAEVITIISFCVHLIVMLGIMLSSFYILIKSIEYSASINRKILAITWCLLCSFLYAYTAISHLILLPLIRPLVCLASIIFVFFLTRQKFETIISAYLLSFGISYCLHYIASFLISFISMFF